jgi:hypothetical protein
MDLSNVTLSTLSLYSSHFEECVDDISGIFLCIEGNQGSRKAES